MLQIKKWGHCIILIAIAVELILWPSLENLIGCGMTLICWIIFSKIGLNETTIKEHIFSWLVFLSIELIPNITTFSNPFRMPLYRIQLR